MKLPLAAMGVLLFLVGFSSTIMGAQALNVCFLPKGLAKPYLCKIVASIPLAQSLVALGVSVVIIGIILIAKASLTTRRLTP